MTENLPETPDTNRTTPSLATWRVREYKVLDLLGEILHWFEVALAGVSVAFVAIGIIYLIGQLFGFSDAVASSDLQTSFEKLLSDILLLVVGIELALMLVRRTPESLIEVMFFVVARKMLIKTDSFWDLILGVAALAGLFAIRKYLQSPPRDSKEDSADAPEDQ